LAKLKKLPLKTNDPKLKCAYPQVQNLPNTDEVRACFIAEEGNNFISIDYNSEESRLLASLSGDKGMLEVFEKGYDMHSYVAYLIYPELIPRDIDIRKIKKDFHDLRQKAKGPEFTFAFLGNWATLVANYGMPKEEAQTIEDNYKKGFAGATKYQEMWKSLRSQFLLYMRNILLLGASGTRTPSTQLLKDWVLLYSSNSIMSYTSGL